jgi:hypothetical protein
MNQLRPYVIKITFRNANTEDFKRSALKILKLNLFFDSVPVFCDSSFTRIFNVERTNMQQSIKFILYLSIIGK